MVMMINDYYKKFPINSRIRIGNSYGTVKYVGEVSGHAGIWLGIEWDDAARGKHNGTVDEKCYFETYRATAGSFIRPDRIETCESLEEAARKRYRNYKSGDILDQELVRETRMHLQASLFEIVGMDKIAHKQSRFEQLMDISVVGSNVNSAGYLKDFSSLTTLNLSSTLIWNWQTVADITHQIPTLIDLNLGCNRFQVPTVEQVVDLEPSFRNLQHINLRNCGFTDWESVKATARLWPNILSVGLQENGISELTPVDCIEIFKNLRELDLHRNKILDFNQVCKLGNIKSLISLNLMENGIDQIQLFDCEPNEKLSIFPVLQKLNLLYNPIWNESDAFNELDKLSSLTSLSKTPHLKSDFDEMFSRAVASITNLKVINKIKITNEERRGAEYDIWKRFAFDWIKACKSPETLREFNKKHRTYAKLIEKYGSPAEFVPREKSASKLIKIRIINKMTGEVWEKKVPRTISVQTLHGLIIKYFRVKQYSPNLSYVDAKHPELVVPLDNLSKSLDYFSIQEGDTVTAEW